MILISRSTEKGQDDRVAKPYKACLKYAGSICCEGLCMNAVSNGI